MRREFRLYLLLLLAGVWLAAVGVWQWDATVVRAAPVEQAATIAPERLRDQGCRLCHEDTDAVIILPSGEGFTARVDLAVLDASVHGHAADDPLACNDCHRPADDYNLPHAPIAAQDRREYTLNQSAQCESCHADPHLTSHPTEGPEAVGCTDCHGSHDVIDTERLLTGEGTSRCVACHENAGVDLRDGPSLTAVIQGDLFSPVVDNDYCLACHELPDRELMFADGSSVSLTIDGGALQRSVHGESNEYGPVACTQCHTDYEYPHEPVEVDNARLYALDKVVACAECHTTNYENTLNSVHQEALDEGNLESAICTDCHDPHATPHPSEPRSQISITCQQCHSTIFGDYAASIHGDALLTEGNDDVPTCVDCHGVHNINDPTTALFRNRSPELCASCHADENLMSQYDISTDVFETYVADFHGTTVTLFEHEDPTIETNKAVCYDCHGVHDIKAPDDPDAGIKQNLLVTCQQCHPDANDNFPDSWTSHFKPSLQNNTLVYLVDLFYWIVIPATVGFFGFMVTTDMYRRVREAMRPPAHATQEEGEEENE